MSRKSSKVIATITVALSLCCNIPRAAAQEVTQENKAPGAAASTSNTAIKKLTPQQTREVVAKAQQDNPEELLWKKNHLAQSDAFMEVLKSTTPNVDESLSFFAAISTKDQVLKLVENTKGKHFEISGTEDNPSVTIASGEASFTKVGGMGTNAMPRCGKAWAAFSAWIAGTTLMCAPFSGPAAWTCAVAMGLLGAMPDFNDACDG